MLSRGALCAVTLVALGAPAFVEQEYKSNLPADHPAIRYADGPGDDAAARLAEQIARGVVTIDRGTDPLGTLPSLLARLHIRSDSQMLVFSKTSFQAARISPRKPRAIFFNDEVAVAYVPGAPSLEIAAVDPVWGPVFYTWSSDPSGKPALARGDTCIRCHQGPNTAGVPGVYVGSVFPGPDGAPSRDESAIITDHRSPFEERWGGWYVTARSGEPHSRANAVAPSPADPNALVRESPLNLDSVADFVDQSLYPATSSDIVALMTFEHQTQMINLITRVGWDARIGAAEGGNPSGRNAALDTDIEDLVRYMLFTDEVALAQPIEGGSTFARTFPGAGPRDRRGRSLRDFDLRTRLFRYPLSYMVYSAAFDALPAAARRRIYGRLYEVLTGPATPRLSRDDRRAILEILSGTKPDLPESWRRLRLDPSATDARRGATGSFGENGIGGKRGSDLLLRRDRQMP